MPYRKKKDLDAIVAGLEYLESEAGKAGLEEVRLLVGYTVSGLRGWMERTAAPGGVYAERMDPVLSDLIALLERFRKMGKEEVRAALRAIDACEAADGPVR
jgi:hypothetical protein